MSAVWNDEDSYVAPRAAQFDEFESSIAARLGLGAAIDQVSEAGIGVVFERVQELANRLRAELAALPRVQVAQRSAQRCGIVTFNVDGSDPSDIVVAPRAVAVNLNASKPTWSRLDADVAGSAGVVRASPPVYNTGNEIDRLLAVLRASAT